MIARQGQSGERGAGLVRWLAGTAGGFRRTRRGTVLVLILGALALIAVLTIVYVSIGLGDRRAAAVVVQRETAETGTQRIAEYIAEQVGGGAMATLVEDFGGTGGAMLIRRAADYPGTSAGFRSDLSVGPGTTVQQRFSPTGGYEGAWAGPGVIDKRTPSTPFLASTFPSTDDNSFAGTPPVPVPVRWDHISNLAPDGTFVNLYGIAPIIGGVRRSGFDARWGSIPQAPQIDFTTQRVVSFLSWGLYNISASTGDPVLAANVTERNSPAFWSTAQYFFRPARGPVFFKNAVSMPGGNGLVCNSPGSEWYPPYSFCDTDGDGFFDARWFELVDSSDPLNIRSLLPRDSRFRWFAAARVVDLNALVNVNTAMDFRVPARPPGATPEGFTPLGMTPGDIDLRRLLRLTDLPAGAGYSELKQPAVTGGNDDYTNYDATAAATVGDEAYKALRLSLELNGAGVPPAQADLTTAPWGPVNTKTADERAAFYRQVGAAVSGTYDGTTAATATVQLNGRYGLDDLLELFTYRTTNNPLVTSRLEQATGGRDSAGGSTAFGPLRENRGLDTEAWNQDGDPQRYDTQIGQGLGETRAYRRLEADVRQFLTPVNGQRELRAGPVAKASTLDLNAETCTNAMEALKDASHQAPTAAAPVASDRDASAIFRAYARGLLPYAGLPQMWAQGTAPGGAAPRAALCYGGNPELALRAAAHLTANMVDAHDKDSVPSPFTLLIRGDAAGTLSTANYPWWRNPTGTLHGRTVRPGRLDLDPLDPTKLAVTGDNVAAADGAVNVYGVELQPVITEVGSYFFYTDAPTTDGGDDENAGSPPGSEPPITINGDVSAANKDFLGEVLAFHLSNPFDVPIEVTGGADGAAPTGTGDSDFYVEVGGHYIKLAKWADDQNSTPTAVVIKPGKSRVFYVLGADFVTNCHNADNAIDAVAVKAAMDAQFRIAGETEEPVWCREVDTAGAPVASPVDFFGTVSKPSVHLWRKLRAAADTARGKDVLVDRLRDPGTTPTLNRPMAAGNHDVAGTRATPENTPGGDNNGCSVVLWSYIKRHANPEATPLGAVPLYALEPKWTATGQSSMTNLENHESQVTGFVRTDYFGTPNGDDKLKTLIANKLVTPLLKTMSTHASKETEWKKQADFQHTAPDETTPQTLDLRDYNTIYPEVYRNNKEHVMKAALAPPGTGVPVLRLADLLLPLAVGPEYDPAVTAAQETTSGDPAGEERPGRITLTEALAMAVNYSTPTAATADPYRLYYRIGDPRPDAATSNHVYLATDRGSLVLDRFAPYEDLNSSGQFDPGTTASSERSRWPGIPLALHVLNQFTALPDSLAGAGRAVPGLINLNTAPTEAFRLLPLMAPTAETGPDSWANWKLKFFGTAPPTPLPTMPETTWDIGAAVTAYREKADVLDRAGAHVQFDDATAPGNIDGRHATTSIEGLREQPGLATRAELMALTSNYGGGINIRFPETDQIDHLGKDVDAGNLPVRSGWFGSNSVSYVDPADNTKRKTSEIKNSYAEKLLVSSGVLNSVTVRSDVFAVWFVVHGYQPSDTENLRPRNTTELNAGIADPLVPSIAKRYLMVIDRSNVTRLGEKPRVLLFTELPMNP